MQKAQLLPPSGMLTGEELKDYVALKLVNKLSNARGSWTQTSVKIDERLACDDLDDVREIVARMNKLNPNANYSIRRRGRGPRSYWETYRGEYQCYLPLDKSAYVAVYIVEKSSKRTF